MAALSSADAPAAERLRLVRPLGMRGMPTWAAIEALPGGKTRLVVVEKVQRIGAQGDTEIADWIRDVRRIATLEHPNLGRVRDVAIRGSEILVTSDYLDGTRWSEILAGAARPTLETSLRVLLDVLAGLGAMHNLRDAKREPLKVVHGDLTPHCVIVGNDGIARVVLPCRIRHVDPDRPESAYLAPEILLGDESADARADIYSVGAMLWEALSGRPLFEGVQGSAIVTHLLSGRVPRAALPANSGWAEPLADLAARALAADPLKRCSSAAEMAAEIRRVAGVKVPAAARVAAYVRSAFGDRIKARRAEIERGEARMPTEEELAVDVDVRMGAEPPEPLPTATTRPPPPLEGAPPVHVAPPPPVPRTFGPPPIRPRMPTPAAVAPPVPPADEVTERRASVAVPWDPPPPMMPTPPPVTVEAMSASTGAAVVATPPEPQAPLASAAMPPIVMPIPSAEASTQTSTPKGRLAKMAVPISLATFGLVVVVWWLASRTTQAPAATAAQPTAPSATAVATPIPVEPLRPTPATAPEEPAPDPTTTQAPADVPASTTLTAPPLRPGTTWRPAPPGRPSPGRRKYEPEGI